MFWDWDGVGGVCSVEDYVAARLPPDCVAQFVEHLHNVFPGYDRRLHFLYCDRDYIGSAKFGGVDPLIPKIIKI